MKPVAWIVLSVLALLPAAVAMAEPDSGTCSEKGPGQGKGQFFELLKKADTNSDHQVSYEELKAVLPDCTEEQFKKHDHNADGVLSKADRPEGAPGAKPVVERLKAADKDGDKKVTKDEFAAEFPKAPATLFAQLDKDGDGVLTTEDRGQAGRGQGKRPGVTPERLKAADKDGDGKLSKDEFTAAFPKAPDGAFARHDSNGDGYLGPEDHAGRKGEGKPAGDKGKAMAAKLKAADKDQDGNITLEEFKAAFPKTTEERFKKMDRNGDGVLNKSDRKS